MTKFRKSILILGILVLLVVAALGTFVVLSLTGSLKTEAIALEFTVEDAEKVYDGTPLKASGYSITNGYLVEGHESIVTFTGEQTDVGYSFSSLDVKIVNETGFDVTKEYDIKVIGGILLVDKCAVQVNVTAEEVTYDGNKINIGDEYKPDRELPKGHSVKLKIKDKWFEDVGYTVAGNTLTEEYLEPWIIDANGRDVSGNYQINIKSQVKILPRTITISPLNAQKDYDGTPLKCTQYKIDSGSLASGHYIEPIYMRSSGSGDASVTDVNTDDPLAIHAKMSQIYDLEGNRVTANYTIISNTGYLTVNRAPLTIRLTPITVQYGDPMADEFDYTISSTISNLELKFTNPDYLEDLFKDITGLVNTTYTIDSFDIYNESVVVTDMFDVTVVPGNLIVKKREVSFTTFDLSKTYDGNLIFTDNLPELDKLVNDHRLESITCYSDNEDISIENKYSVKSVYLVDEQGQNVSGYYIVKNFAEIAATLNKKTIKFTSNTYEKVYDGTPLSGGALGYDSLASGDRLVYEPASITYVNQTGKANKPATNDVKILNSNGDDVTELYDLDFNGCGALIITERDYSITLSPVYGNPSPGADLTGIINIEGLASGDIPDYSDVFIYVSGAYVYITGTISIKRGGVDVTDCYNIFDLDSVTGSFIPSTQY